MVTRAVLGALLGVLLSAPPLPARDQARVSYQAEARFDGDGGRLHGRLRLTVPGRLARGGREIRLDLAAGGQDDDGARLTLGPVEVSRPAEVAREGDVLVVTLEEALPAPEEVTLSAEFSTRVWAQLEEWLGYPAFWGDEPGRLWYPDLFAPDGTRVRFRDFDVTLTHPDDHAVLTSGREMESAVTPGGLRRSRFVAEGLEGFAVNLTPGFERYEVPAGDTTVVALVPPDDREAFEKAARYTAEAVAWYREAYGFFPQKRLGIVPGEKTPIGGFPLPGLFVIHRGYVDDDFLRWITAHEVGHYYWGLHVLAEGPDRLDWLLLAQGIWADQLYLARLHGRSLAEQWRGRGRGNAFTGFFTALAGNHDQTLGLTQAEYEGRPYDYNSDIGHAKAALGLYLLSRRMGVEAFLALQRDVLREYARRPFGLEDFLERLEAHGAPWARELLTAWMKDGARVEYAVLKVTSERDADGWSHHVAVGRSGSIPTDLDVELLMEDGTTVRRTLDVSGFEEERRQDLEIRHEARLRQVRLDPDGVLPMVNGVHPLVRRAALVALDRAGQYQLFLDLAPAYLELEPDDEHVRLLVGRRLLLQGRLGEAREALRFSVEAEGEPCETYDRCAAALMLAEAQARLDHVAPARALLDRVRVSAASRRLAWRWGQVDTLVAAR